jgi:hypothetical protein
MRAASDRAPTSSASRGRTALVRKSTHSFSSFMAVPSTFNDQAGCQVADSAQTAAFSFLAALGSWGSEAALFRPGAEAGVRAWISGFWSLAGHEGWAIGGRATEDIPPADPAWAGVLGTDVRPLVFEARVFPLRAFVLETSFSLRAIRASISGDADGAGGTTTKEPAGRGAAREQSR